jgi:hypothetical protein
LIPAHGIDDCIEIDANFTKTFENYWKSLRDLHSNCDVYINRIFKNTVLPCCATTARAGEFGAIREQSLMTPDERAILQGIADELPLLERRAAGIGDSFLAFLIASAAGEARDQLRDAAFTEGEGARANGVNGVWACE